MSTGFTSMGDEHLIRSELWSKQLKQLLMDDLYATKFVKVIEEFPDGTTFTIPSLGESETADFSEGQAIRYNRMDTGEFQFSFDQYVYSANSISEKFKRDSYYSDEVVAAFLPRQHRAIMERVEARILGRGPAAQTASNLNAINGANHRWIAKGTSETLSLKDFQLARYALKKANVPLSNLCAIIDPSAAYNLQNQANVFNLMTPSAQWERVVNEGISTGMQFRFNILGFDVYESNYLADYDETIDGATASTGKANLFFSAAPGDTMPIIGGFRQMPTVYSEFNKDLQQTEYLTIAEFGFKLYRPENMVVVISDDDQVS